MSPKTVGFSISVEKRIILHLVNCTHYIDRFEVGEEITQKGIADILQIRVTHVSRALKRIEMEGLLFKRKAIVKNRDRRMKTYYLTKKGIEYGNAVKAQMTNQSIYILTNDGELRETKLWEIEKLYGIKIDPLTAYTLTLKKGMIDLSHLKN